MTVVLILKIGILNDMIMIKVFRYVYDKVGMIRQNLKTNFKNEIKVLLDFIKSIELCENYYKINRRSICFIIKMGL